MNKCKRAAREMVGRGRLVGRSVDPQLGPNTLFKRCTQSGRQAAFSLSLSLSLSFFLSSSRQHFVAPERRERPARYLFAFDVIVVAVAVVRSHSPLLIENNNASQSVSQSVRCNYAPSRPSQYILLT